MKTLSILTCVFIVASSHANVTVTPATGGTNLSADKSGNASSPAWTTLGGITIGEAGTGKTDIGGGTLVIKTPSGFEFNPAASVTCSFTSGKNITGASAAVSDASTLTVTISTNTASGAVDSLTISGVQVRPVSGSPLAAAAHLYRPTTGGTANVVGVVSETNGTGSGTSFGALSEVVGNAARLTFISNPASATVGTPIGTQPVVRTLDQFGNNSTTALGASVSVAFSLAAGAGPLMGTTTYNIGTSGGNGVVTGANLQINSSGADKQLSASAAGLTTALSSVFSVAAGNQAITFPTIAAHTFGDSPFAISATASSGLPVTFTVASGPATVLGNTITLTGAGQVSITASQPGDANWNAASDITQQFNVTQGASTVIWTNPAAIIYGTPLDTNQLNATASVPGTFVYAPAAGTILTVGTNTLTVTFTPDDTNTYSVASASVELDVVKATPSITWLTPSDIVYTTALSSNQLNASASVAGTFSYTPDFGIILNAGTNQSLSVTFTPDDTTNYNSAGLNVSINVLKATPTLTWTNPTDIVFGTALSDTQLNAGSSVAGTLIYSPTNGTILNAGTNLLFVSFLPDDAANYNSAGATVSLVVAKATPTLTWLAPADIVYGTALSTHQLNASSSVAGTFVYAPDFGTVLNAGRSQALSVAFTPDDSTNYNSAGEAVSINVLKATPSILWTNSTNIIYGTPLGSNQLNAMLSVPASLIYSPAAGTVLDTSTNQVLSVTAIPADTNNWNSASASVVLEIDPANLVVTADSFSRFVGTTNQTFTGTITGLTNGDLISATYSCAATTGSLAGLYPITPQLVDPSNRLTNYNVTINPGLLTVLDPPMCQANGGSMCSSGSNFVVQVAGPTNVTYLIEATCDLNSGVWLPLGQTTLGASGLQEFQDTTATNAFKFYRILVQ